MLPLVPRVDDRGRAPHGDRLLPAEGPAGRAGPGCPIEGRWRFLRRRVRETVHDRLGYARLLLEMQELWLATRIRREEYAFVGDLRALRKRAAAALDLKTNGAACTRHWPSAPRRAGQPRGSAAGFSAVMIERLETLREAMGKRSEELAREASTCEISNADPSAPACAIGDWPAGRSAKSSAAQPGRPPRLEPYWPAERRLRRRRVWRLNPFALAWNAARDIKNAVVFFAAMGLTVLASVT